MVAESRAVHGRPVPRERLEELTAAAGLDTTDMRDEALQHAGAEQVAAARGLHEAEVVFDPNAQSVI